MCAQPDDEGKVEHVILPSPTMLGFQLDVWAGRYPGVTHRCYRDRRDKPVFRVPAGSRRRIIIEGDL